MEALLDDRDRRTRRGAGAAASSSPRAPANCNYRYQPTKPLVYQVNPAVPATHEEVVMNSYDTFVNNIHDRVVGVDYYSTNNKKSTAMAY